jgi:hypothetical protein
MVCVTGPVPGAKRTFGWRACGCSGWGDFEAEIGCSHQRMKLEKPFSQCDSAPLSKLVSNNREEKSRSVITLILWRDPCTHLLAADKMLLRAKGITSNFRSLSRSLKSPKYARARVVIASINASQSKHFEVTKTVLPGSWSKSHSR